jgi:predicted  nucleic acid-binding Zn-ribbon protein
LKFSWKPGDYEPIRKWLADNQKATDYRKAKKERPGKRIKLQKKVMKCQQDLKNMVEQPTDAEIESAATRRACIQKDIKSLKDDIKKSDDDSEDLSSQLAKLKREEKALPKRWTASANR